jgi:hypothetical protein
VHVLVHVHVHVHVHVLGQPPQGTADTSNMLDFEKLDVYRCAIEHLAFVFKAIPRIPRGYSAVVDQWRRAAMSGR